MLKKQVQVVRVNTMSDKTVRLTIDLLNGNSEDIKSAFELMEGENMMVVASVDEWNAAEQLG